MTSGMSGRVVDDPENPDFVANTLGDIFTVGNQIEAWGRNARQRITRGFLVFSEARLWLQLLTETASLRRPVAS